MELVSNFVYTPTGALMVTLASLLLYNVLRKIFLNLTSRVKLPPGPFGLPIFGYLPFLGSQSYKTLFKMKEKYGNIIGMNLNGKYTVILNDWDTAKEVLSNPVIQDRAEHLFDHTPEIGFEVMNGDEWVEQRRFCMSAARDLGIGRGQWEDIILDEVSNYIEELNETKGEAVDISHSLGFSLSSNVISLLIGRPLQKVAEADKVRLSLDYSDAAFRFMGCTSLFSLIPGLRTLFETFRIAGYDKAAKDIAKFEAFTKQEVDRHKMSSKLRNERDFINMYLDKMDEMKQSKDTIHWFDEKNLRGNVNILFLGASDTTFSSITWLLRLLAKHQDVQGKVYGELMEVLGREGKARYSERTKVPYTFAVINEAQRMSSIVPLSTTRRATDTIEINGYTIPKGTEIMGNIWGMHNDPTYWDKPEQFRPERFLTPDGKKAYNNMPSFAPFSIGRRNCPGQTVAFMEIMGYISEIIKHFEVSLEPGVEANFECVVGLVNLLKPQKLRFKPRSTD